MEPLLFVQRKLNRNRSMLLRLSREEKEFLRDEANRRGLTMVMLIRQCVRNQLVPEPRVKKAG